ncbi:MAG TPA: hypothetical protein DHW39_03480 [Erysipelotrichaceae bacterium]|nr:hypothetical protein [Erysipelotrichaceae bacterium]
MFQNLFRSALLNAKESLLDLVTSFGAVQLADYAENSDAYYLVEQKGRQTLVRISEEFLMSQDLADTVDPKKFVIADNIFAKAVYQMIRTAENISQKSRTACAVHSAQYSTAVFSVRYGFLMWM